MPRACPLFSGGKDSCYATHWAVLHGFEVPCIVNLRPRGWESTLLHHPASHLLPLHAEALGVKLIQGEAPSSDPEEEVEALAQLLAEARVRCGCTHTVSGALLSDYQRLRFAIAAEEAGLKSLTPLWRKNQEEYMRWLVRDGFQVMVLSVQAYGLPEDLPGKVLTPELVEEVIKLARLYGFNPAFEGGEAETMVLDAPLYRARIVVRRGRRVKLAPHHVVFEVEEAELQPKT